MQTRVSPKLVALVGLCGVALAQAACNAEAPADEELATDSTEQPIIGNPDQASTHPEAALVDMVQGGRVVSHCSGALIAPRVVLTAGHCIDRYSAWVVTLPFAGGQRANGVAKENYDYLGNTGEFVNPNQHDVGLVILDRALSLSAFPEVASRGSADGALAVAVGRKRDGALSTTALYESDPFAIRSAAPNGSPYAYRSERVIEPGDSGGPVYASGTKRIVAVNSGTGSTYQVLARTDLLSAWIAEKVRANGGPGATTPSPTPAPTPAPTGCNANEREPNDTFGAATALTNGTTCGALSSASDQDWFSFDVARAGDTYKVGVTGSVSVALWKKTASGYQSVATTSAGTFHRVASSAGTYVGVVYGEAPAGYRVDVLR